MPTRTWATLAPRAEVLGRVACALVALGCGPSRPGGGAADASTAGEGGDGAPDALSPVDAGDGAKVPALDAAPPTAPPAVEYLGGPILSSPRVVTVTYQNDDPALVGRLQQFDDSITSTAWWSAATSEYCVKPAGSPCVGAGTGAGHVVLPAAPSGYTDSVRGADSTLRALLTANVGDGTLPAPGAGTLYVLYLPAGTTVLLDGNASCAPSSFGSYHDDLTVTVPDGGAPVDVAYAVVPRCSSTEAATTIAASHELVEAATDPSPENAPAFQITDMVWGAFGPEVADVCAAVDTQLTATESGFAVQRSWSAASAAAGHDPCVPVPPGEAYFNVAPEQGTETIGLGVGESATIALYPFTDAADGGSWQLSGVAASGSPLTFSVQPSTVVGGTRTTVTVTLASKPALGVDQLYGLVSQSASDTHVWPMIVQAH